MLNRNIKNQIKKEGYLHYFDWEMYFIICISYLFGFLAGFIRAIFLILSLIFLAYPFYLKSKKEGRMKTNIKDKHNRQALKETKG